MDDNQNPMNPTDQPGSVITPDNQPPQKVPNDNVQAAPPATNESPDASLQNPASQNIEQVTGVDIQQSQAQVGQVSNHPGDPNPKSRASNSKNILLLLFIAATGFIFGFAGLYLLNGSGSDSYAIIGNAEQEAEFVDKAYNKLLSLDSISYDYEISGSINYEGSIATDYRGSNPNVFAAATTSAESDSISYEVMMNGPEEKTFFRYTDISESSEDQEFINKWIEISKNTTEGIASGSEYLGLFLFAPLEWNIPFLVGNVSPDSEVGKILFDKNYYDIVSISRSEYNSKPAIKAELSVNSTRVRQLLEIFLAREEGENLSVTSPGGSLYVSQYNNEEKDFNFSIWVDPDSAEMLAAIRQLEDSSSSASLGGSDYIYSYSNFVYDNPEQLKFPTDAIPFNEYFPTND